MPMYRNRTVYSSLGHHHNGGNKTFYYKPFTFWWTVALSAAVFATSEMVHTLFSPHIHPDHSAGVFSPLQDHGAYRLEWEGFARLLSWE